MPGHADWGRFANHFGTAHKAFFITADTMSYTLSGNFMRPLRYMEDCRRS